MSGDQLTIRTPGDRVIVEYLCDSALIGESAAQLQQTGEETRELHRFMTSIIAGQIDVQDGISIDALRDMALTVGDGLGPLGEYFCELATAAWAYADACRVAGDLTKHLFERTGNLSNSLQALVTEREQDEGWASSVRALPEDGTASGGSMIAYSVLNEEGALNDEPNSIALDGLPRDEALRKIESHQASIQTLHDNVHRRNDEHLAAWDAAVEAWETEANAFVRALDGILGVLADTRAENNYQRVGTLGDAASWAGLGFDIVVLIPGGQAIGVAGGKVVSVVEDGAEAGQLIMLGSGSRDGTIRTAEGQLAGEALSAGEGQRQAPIDSMLKKAGLRSAWRELITAVSGGATKGLGVVEDGIDPGRAPKLPEDIQLDTEPIAEWQPRADATNPEVEVTPNRPMPTSEERAKATPQDPDSAVRIPTAEAGEDDPVAIPETQPRPTVTAPEGDADAEEPESITVDAG
ncbi:hypothetical protein [Agrococcus sp. ARC_14]|uniref:hypothetical protein n=1 Tax=Agrococcus sp. ARC_14 TaxID=2919927 RepID=UPI001F06D39A|nr:hypothetical protein [Agrococcus sp. ARC_14]MCH1882078.1 hypothetical protein [Agrococcus sp. ARC_14]